MQNDIRRVDRVIWISIAIVVFLAIQDVLGLHMWSQIGGFGSEAYTKAEPLYMQQFWLFAYALIGIVALTYYLMRRDKSEALALVAIPTILLWSGWEDILYYIFTGIKFFGTTMPWLYSSKTWFMKLIADFMGASTVTSTTLLVSAGIGAIIAIFVYKWLKQARW